MELLKTTLEFLAKSDLYVHEKPFVVVPAQGAIDRYSSGAQARLDNLFFSAEPVEIHDVRTLPTCNLSVNGFEIVHHDFGDLPHEESAIRNYRHETTEVLKNTLKAEYVHCYDFKWRRNTGVAATTYDANDPLFIHGPPTGVHCDLTPKFAAKTVRALLKEHGLAHYLRPGWRIRVVNTWRPLVPKLEDRPLAFCDSRSLDKKDLIATDRIYPHRETELYYVQHNELQQWYWFSGQTPRELLLFLSFDTHPQGGATYCPHNSFDNPLASESAPPRISVETRSIVISKMDDAEQKP